MQDALRAAAEARDSYIAELENAWRSPKAEPPPSPLPGESPRDAYVRELSLFRLRVSHHLGRATFPAPASSNAACGFPALRSPVCFASRLMGPILPERLSALVEPLGSH